MRVSGRCSKCGLPGRKHERVKVVHADGSTEYWHECP